MTIKQTKKGLTISVTHAEASVFGTVFNHSAVYDAVKAVFGATLDQVFAQFADAGVNVHEHNLRFHTALRKAPVLQRRL